MRPECGQHPWVNALKSDPRKLPWRSYFELGLLLSSEQKLQEVPQSEESEEKRKITTMFPFKNPPLNSTPQMGSSSASWSCEHFSNFCLHGMILLVNIVSFHSKTD